MEQGATSQGETGLGNVITKIRDGKNITLLRHQHGSDVLVVALGPNLKATAKPAAYSLTLFDVGLFRRWTCGLCLTLLRT